MKVALLEVSHWHFPLYQPALEAADIEVVGVSDRSEAHRQPVAAAFGCPAFADWRELVALDGIDFAFAFGRHAEMPAIAEALIARNTPFALEKPCGVNAEQVARLRRMADDANVYVATPFIFRQSDLLAEVRHLDHAPGASFSHMSFRFIAGPLSRYQQSGSAWMLDPAIAGGGCAINLAIHFVDLFRVLTGRQVQSVSAHMHRTDPSQVEDYALLTLTAADGAIGVIETGYRFPGDAKEQRDFSFALSSDRYYVRSADAAIGIRDRSDPAGGTLTRPVRLDTDGYYAVFVETVLADQRTGARPPAGLRDAAAAMRVIDAAYASARDTGAPKTP